MDQQSLDNIEYKKGKGILEEKTLSYSFSVVFTMQHIPKQTMPILSSMIHTFDYERYHWIKYCGKVSNMISIDYLHIAKNIAARADSIFKNNLKYNFACNYYLKQYIIASAVLYKRYLDGTIISLGLLFLF